MKRFLIRLSLLFIISFCHQSYADTTGLLFIVSSSGTTLNIKSVKANYTYPQVGIKIITPGYSLKNSGTECIPNANGYCLFSTNDKTPATISITGPSGKIKVILCLNGKGPLSCQSYNNLQIIANPKYAYVLNSGSTTSDTVALCPLDPVSGAILPPCVDAGGGSAINNVNGLYAQGITLNGNSNMAYITSYNDTGVIYQCPIVGGGVFASGNSCFSIPITSPDNNFASYYGLITLNSNSKIAYLSDNGTSGPRVLACSVDDSGNIQGNSCGDTGAYDFTNSPYLVGITFNKDETTAYISHYVTSPAGVTVCNVSNGTHFSPCRNKTGGGSVTFSSPQGIALNSSGTILYIADNGNAGGVVYGCYTTPNNYNSSTFDNCFTAATIIDASFVALNADNTEAYVTDFIANTYVCSISPNDGTFSCGLPTNGFNSPSGIALGY